MIKQFIKLYKRHTNNRKFKYLKLELIEHYDSLSKFMKEREVQEWEEDYFKGVLISIRVSATGT